jgi:hypothetical protein
MHPTRIFKSPEDLESAWKEYKADIEKQSEEWLKVQYVGKDGDRKADPQKVPYTLEGFKRFCRSKKKYGEVEQYFTNQDGLYSDFIGICSHVKEEIRENQIVGGMLGFYNHSITQRLNSLVEKKETELKGSLNIPNLPDIGNRK